MMNKQAFEQLYQKYLLGECTADEIRLVEHWFENIEEDPTLSLPDWEKERLEEELLERILQQTRPPVSKVLDKPFIVRRNSLSFYARIAASVLLVGMLAWYARHTFLPEQSGQALAVFEPGTEQICHTNTLAVAQTIRLEDGSKVTLTPGSTLSYPRYALPDKRKVQLRGDAFFEVAKNLKKPFFVHSGRLVAQVLGTSFWVKTQAHSKAIQVEVRTGRVSVYENKCQVGHTNAGSKKNDGDGIVLSPNQRVTFFAEKPRLVPGLVDNPVVVNPPKSPALLVYEDTPLPRVLKDLEKVYAIELVMANEQMKTCTVMGDLTGMSLYQQLDMICKATKASYEVRGTRIVISGNGCE